MKNWAHNYQLVISKPHLVTLLLPVRYQPHGLLTMNALKEGRFNFNIFGKTS